MGIDRKNELYSLAEHLHANLSDVLSLARLVAGDEQLRDISDLSDSGTAELISLLKTYGQVRRDWIAEMQAIWY